MDVAPRHLVAVDRLLEVDADKWVVGVDERGIRHAVEPGSPQRVDLPQLEERLAVDPQQVVGTLGDAGLQLGDERRDDLVALERDQLDVDA